MLPTSYVPDVFFCYQLEQEQKAFVFLADDSKFLVTFQFQLLFAIYLHLVVQVAGGR